MALAPVKTESLKRTIHNTFLERFCLYCYWNICIDVIIRNHVPGQNIVLQGHDSKTAVPSTCIGIPIIKKRQSRDCLIFIIRIPFVKRRLLHNEMDHCCLLPGNTKRHVVSPPTIMHYDDSRHQWAEFTGTYHYRLRRVWLSVLSEFFSSEEVFTKRSSEQIILQTRVSSHWYQRGVTVSTYLVFIYLFIYLFICIVTGIRIDCGEHSSNTVEQTVQLTVIWDTITPTWRHCEI